MSFVDELSARSVKWCIGGVTGNVRLFTALRGDVKNAKTFEYASNGI